MAKITKQQIINAALITLWGAAIFATLRLLLPDFPGDLAVWYLVLPLLIGSAAERRRAKLQSKRTEATVGTVIPRFGLDTLFISMTLIGLGLSGLGVIHHVRKNEGVSLLLFAASWLIITAGLVSVIPIQWGASTVGRGHGWLRAFASPYGLIVACAMIFFLILLQSAT